MKKYFSIIIITFLIIMIAAPSVCTSGAKYGVELWLYNVLPVLLPFIILSNLLVSLNVCETLAKFAHPLIKHIFHTSLYGTYVVIIGLLSGYPMGVKAASDLLRRHLISDDEAKYLLTFCNNPSPMYMLGYAAAVISAGQKTAAVMLASIYISAYFTSALYRIKRHARNRKKHTDIPRFKNPSVGNGDEFQNIWSTIETSILNGFITAVKLGGYIIIFSIIVTLFSHISVVPQSIKAVISCLIEMTSGAYRVSDANINYGIKIVTVTATSMLGGLSVTFQTAGVLSDTSMSMKHYIKYKLTSSAICALILLIYVSFTH